MPAVQLIEAGAAGHDSGQMALDKELIDIERKLWTNDAVVYQDRLVEEALLVFSDTGVITRDTAVTAILDENAKGRRWAEVEFDAIRSLPVAPEVVLLTYSVVARWEHEKTKMSALASSLYVKPTVYGNWHSISRRR